MATYSDHLLGNYAPHDIHFIKGKGASLFDKKKRKYIDFLSGLGVNNLGHAHPAVIASAKKALKQPLHLSNLYTIPSQIEAAALLQQISFSGKSFFANSGAEANEAAYKFALKYGKGFSEDKNQIIVLKNSFHGRTMAALSMTAQEKYQKPFTPFPGNVVVIEGNDSDALQKAFSDKTAALLVEFIQGESGIYPLTQDFVREVRKLCNEHKALLIADEVQSGCARTGRSFAFQHYDVQVDAFTCAKALAGGFPIGAFTVRDKHKDVFSPGDHASTFGGNPFVTEVACACIKLYGDLDFLLEVQKREEQFTTWFKTLIGKYKFIESWRGKGLMLALEFDAKNYSTNALYQSCLKRGLLVNSIGDHTIRFLPPLVISQNEMQKGMQLFEQALKDS